MIIIEFYQATFEFPHVEFAAPFHLKRLSNISGNLWLVDLSLVGLIFLVHGWYGQRVFDDAYITYRYARNISNGGGFVYNLGQPVLGITTPLFAVLLAGISKIAGSEMLPRTAFILNMIVEGINVLLLFRLAIWIFTNWKIAAFISLAYIFHPLRMDVASGGMEAPLYLCFLLLTYTSYLVSERKSAAAMWAGLAFLIRPDSLIATLPVFVDCFFRDRRIFFKQIYLFILIITPWIFFSTAYFGHPLPNTILAKSISYRNPPGHALLFLITFLGTGSLNIYLPIIWILAGFLISGLLLVTGGMQLLKLNPGLVVMLVFPLLFCLLMSIQNPAMWFPWYYLPLIPVGIITLTAAVWCPLSRFPVPRWFASSLLIVLIIGVPGLINRLKPSWDPERVREAVYWEACSKIKTDVTQRDIILAPDIGVVGWCLDQAVILDPIGLVSPETLSYQRELLPNQWISPDLVRDYSPEYIVSFDLYLNHLSSRSSLLEDFYQLIWQKEIAFQNEEREMRIYKKILLDAQ